MRIIGVDPGVKGGIAIIPLLDFEGTKTYPLEGMTNSDISTLLDGEEGHIFIEQPSLNPYLGGTPCPRCKAKPMRNSQSFWKLGRSLGFLEGVATAKGHKVDMISPMKWQNYLKCSTGGNKRITLDLAIKAFPQLSRKLKGTGKIKSNVTHAVADALLIALYGYLQYPSLLPECVRSVVPHITTKLCTVEFKSTLKGSDTSVQRPPAVPNRAGPVRSTARSRISERSVRRTPPVRSAR